MPTPAGALTGVSAQDLPYTCVVLSSAARTAAPIPTTDPGFATPNGASSALFVVVTSALVSSPSIDVIVEGYDPASNTWYNIITAAAIVTATTTFLRVMPGVIDEDVANVILPEVIRVRVTHADADSITYSVGVTFGSI